MTRVDTPSPHFASSLQQAENGDAGLCADEHLAVGDGRGDELVAGSELVAAIRGLRAVVELVRQVAGIVSMQHRRAGVLVSPYDAVGGAIGGDRRRCTRVGKAGRAMRSRV